MPVKRVNKMEEGKSEYELIRYPHDPKENLRAWDAADEYLINYVHNDLQESLEGLAKKSVLIVNDSFGALSLGLEEFEPVVLTDSVRSSIAIRKNFVHNGVDDSAIEILHSLDSYDRLFDLVLVKVPKTLARLTFQLSELMGCLSDDCGVIGGGMTKTIHNSTIAEFEKIIGPTTTSLAVKKARLIFADPQPGMAKKEVSPVEYEFNGTRYCSLAGVFSSGKFDRGSALLLSALPARSGIESIIDLGCGCGILGVESAKIYQDAKITFVDDSFAAIESAKINSNHLRKEGRTEFRHIDCLEGLDSESNELIVCNPPFHQSNSVSTSVALRMFADSKRVLKSDGELFVVGNKHLGYHKRLLEIFGNVEELKSDDRFVVLMAKKTSDTE